ncbi:MAG: pyridoxal phosphate-dependent aminotransferase [Eubacterium sp.]|jgi:aspartate/tyrosine/aromatic aminotransferase
MGEELMAALNGRVIPKSDKVFGINTMAAEMAAERGAENVVNATIGALIDDDRKLIVLSSVDKVFRSLKPEEYAAYAPISGTPAFKKASIRAALGNFTTKRHLRAVATMGGTGGIKNTVSNYSSPGDTILTTDWRWGPYSQIASEIGRKLATFSFFDENRRFNAASLEQKAEEIISKQDRLILILNTPAHNPTGYSMTVDDWKAVLDVMKKIPPEKKVALLIDCAYIDYAGDEDEVRRFLTVVDEMPDNVLPIMCYSFSKTLTFYGMRTGAMICMAPNEAIADEFAHCCEFSCRASWSNPNRAGQSIVTKIYEDPELLNAVTEERRIIRDMLLARGKAFEKAAEDCGLVTVPFSSGFFVSVPSDEPDALAARLREEGIFLIPLAKGVRVSVASVSEKICGMLPARIKAAAEAK